MSGGGIVLVTGGTGRQGGAAVRHLLHDGRPVRVLTRHPDGPAAARLAGLGAEVVGGDLDDPGSVRAALDQVAAVFSVQDYWQPGVGYAGEVRQGRTLVDEAARAGVGLFVQSSMAGDGAPEVPHFASKAAVAECLGASGLPHVVLGLVVFMDNLVVPRDGRLMLPTLAGGLGRRAPLELVATDDVGAAVARVVADPAPYLGRRVDLVGDVLTVPAMRAVYRRALRRPLLPWALPRVVLPRLAGEFAEQLVWHRRHPQGWPGLDRSGVDGLVMTDFAAFLSRHRPWLL
ncbi:MAG: NmrA family NAD(P)-binding protein [Dermatophilaceae bacterium]